MNEIQLKDAKATLSHIPDKAMDGEGSIATGLEPGFEDIAIAATGTVHGLTVLTDNLKDFLPLGIVVLNPTAALPAGKLR